MSHIGPKEVLRQAARDKRAALSAAQPDFAAAVARHADALGIAPGTVVGGYHALKDEADPALLLARLAGLGCRIAYPRVAAKNAPLDFHLVPAGEVLTPGAFGVREPRAHWPASKPSVLLVPLLAFDARGHRLGYGGGYYDRTLAGLKVPAYGVAFAGQEVSSLPGEAHDMALDGIITEQGLRRFR